MALYKYAYYYYYDTGILLKIVDLSPTTEEAHEDVYLMISDTMTKISALQSQPFL